MSLPPVAREPLWIGITPLPPPPELYISTTFVAGRIMVIGSPLVIEFCPKENTVVDLYFSQHKKLLFLVGNKTGYTMGKPCFQQVRHIGRKSGGKQPVFPLNTG